MTVKSQEFFTGIFAAAVAAAPKDSKNSEYVALHKAVIDCIREGVNDQGYVRNSLGYNADLPSKTEKERVGKKVTYFTRSELFGRVWNAAMNEVRLLVANATANEVWKFQFIGMRGANGLIGPYCSAIEKEADEVSFIASKDDVPSLETAGHTHSKISKTGQKTFSLPMADFVEFLARKFPNQDINKKEHIVELVENEETGETEEQIVETVYTTHNKFVEVFRAKLGKYTAFRTQRMSMGLADVAEMYENW